MELAWIMPMILLVLISCITLTFYFYDKCILAGMSAEIAVTAAEQIRNGEDSLAELNQEFQSKTERKMVLLRQIKLEIEEKGTDVTVQLEACRGAVKCRAYGYASVCKPEEYIRIHKEISEYEN